jgi:hypothetical protein
MERKPRKSSRYDDHWEKELAEAPLDKRRRTIAGFSGLVRRHRVIRHRPDCYHLFVNPKAVRLFLRGADRPSGAIASALAAGAVSRVTQAGALVHGYSVATAWGAGILAGPALLAGALIPPGGQQRAAPGSAETPSQPCIAMRSIRRWGDPFRPDGLTPPVWWGPRWRAW